MSSSRNHDVPASSRAPDEAADAEFIGILSQRIREARARRAMTRKVVALNAGVSERYLAQVETGQTNPSIMVLRHITHALGISVLELLKPQQEPVEHQLIAHFLQQLPAQQLEEALLHLMQKFGNADISRKKRIAMIGLRGAGKSTLGRALANELALPFIELNSEIEAEAGMSLNEVFSLYGQPGFRRLERRCLENCIARHESAVFAVGGGIVSEAATFNLLLVNCFTVWLKTSPEAHMARVLAQGDSRPMEGNLEVMDDMRRILAARDPSYSKADFTLDTTGQPLEESLMRLRRAVTNTDRAPQTR